MDQNYQEYIYSESIGIDSGTSHFGIFLCYWKVQMNKVWMIVFSKIFFTFIIIRGYIVWTGRLERYTSIIDLIIFLFIFGFLYILLNTLFFPLDSWWMFYIIQFVFKAIIILLIFEMYQYLSSSIIN